MGSNEQGVTNSISKRSETENENNLLPSGSNPEEQERLSPNSKKVI